MINLHTVNGKGIFLNFEKENIYTIWQGGVKNIAAHEIVDLTITNDSIVTQDVIEFMRKHRKDWQFYCEESKILTYALSLGFVEKLTDNTYTLTEVGMIMQKRLGLKW